MSDLSLPVLHSDAGLTRYMSEIKKFPMLTETEEKELARRWYEEEDIEAAQKLVTSHLRLVAKIAMQFKGYGLPMHDVIAEGNIGLMTAVKKFNPNKGFRLATYAMWWIKAMIQDYVLKSWSMVRLGTSATQKKLFFNLRKLKSKITNAHRGNISAEETNELIAEELGVSQADVAEMDKRFTAPEASLNVQAYGDNESTEVIDLLPDATDNQETILLERQDLEHKRALFAEAMQDLNEREQDILMERKMKSPATTLDVLSNKYGVSAERIRQIEEKALSKLKSILNPAVN